MSSGRPCRSASSWSTRTTATSGVPSLTRRTTPSVTWSASTPRRLAAPRLISSPRNPRSAAHPTAPAGAGTSTVSGVGPLTAHRRRFGYGTTRSATLWAGMIDCPCRDLPGSRPRPGPFQRRRVTCTSSTVHQRPPSPSWTLWISAAAIPSVGLGSSRAQCGACMFGWWISGIHSGPPVRSPVDPVLAGGEAGAVRVGRAVDRAVSLKVERRMPNRAAVAVLLGIGTAETVRLRGA
jgi:hypothetical protein